MLRLHRTLACALIVLMSCGIQAKEKPKPVLSAESKAQFEDQSAAIRAQLAPGGRFEFVQPTERSTIERRLTDIEKLLASTDNANDLKDNDKVALLVAQEEINAILTKRDGERLICESVSPVGSHRKIQQCETYAKRETERRDSERYMRDSNRRAITKCIKGLEGC